MLSFTIMEFILLFYMLPFVENLNWTRGARKGAKVYEPISALDIAFDEFPKLIDVMPNLVQKTSFDYKDMPGVTVKNLSIDMDKINMNKLRRKMDIIAGRFGIEEPTVNASRRQAYINWGLGVDEFWKGSYHMLRRKILDVMLQVLYMARHKIHKLESAKHFSTKDTGFRIAYTYRMLTRIYRKMMRLYSYQARYREYRNPIQQLILHGRVSRLHVDFCYLYWVLIKIDGAYKQAKGIRKEKAKIQKMLEEQIQAQKDAQSAVKGAAGQLENAGPVLDVAPGGMQGPGPGQQGPGPEQQGPPLGTQGPPPPGHQSPPPGENGPGPG